MRLKPASGLNQVTYGLQFVDYLPYYWMGVCHLKTGDNPTAIRMFNHEEDRRRHPEEPALQGPHRQAHGSR